MIPGQSTVILYLAILVSILTTVTCVTLLVGLYRSKKLKRSSTAIAALVFSNGVIGAVSLPIWIYLTYGMNPFKAVYTKLHVAYNFVDITLVVATSLQLLLISYEQLRIKARGPAAFNNAEPSARYWSLSCTWAIGLASAIFHAIFRITNSTLIIIPAFILLPFICIVLCFIGMLFTKAAPNASAEQQYGATTKTGLIVLSCGACLIPSMLAIFLYHLDLVILNNYQFEVLVFLRYLNVLLTTVIHGYKSVDFGPGAFAVGKHEIVHVFKDTSHASDATSARPLVQ